MDEKKVDAIIDLDVGGKRFRTTRQTLLSDPTSMLAKMFNPESPISPGIKKGGAYFLDRDPVYFRVVLNYLRSGHLDLDSCNATALLKEASFFGLSGLEAALQELAEEQKAVGRGGGGKGRKGGNRDGKQKGGADGGAGKGRYDEGNAAPASTADVSVDKKKPEMEPKKGGEGPKEGGGKGGEGDAAGKGESGKKEAVVVEGNAGGVGGRQGTGKNKKNKEKNNKDKEGGGEVEGSPENKENIKETLNNGNNSKKGKDKNQGASNEEKKSHPNKDENQPKDGAKEVKGNNGKRGGGGDEGGKGKMPTSQSNPDFKSGGGGGEARKNDGGRGQGQDYDNRARNKKDSQGEYSNYRNRKPVHSLGAGLNPGGNGGRAVHAAA